MKNILSYVFACLLLAALSYGEEAAPAGKPETFLIIKVYDHAKKPSLKLVTDAEYKAETDAIAQEAKLWDKAMAAAEKAWKADSSTAKKTFPKSFIAQKKISVIKKDIADQSKGTTEIAKLEKSLEEDLKAEEKRLAERKQSSAGNIAKRKTDDGKAASERAALLDSARSLFETKLTEVASPAAPAEPAAPEKKATKK